MRLSTPADKGMAAARSGMTDLFEMMQSPTFVQQLGYGVLRIALLSFFPELRPLFQQIEHGSVEWVPLVRPERHDDASATLNANTKSSGGSGGAAPRSGSAGRSGVRHSGGKGFH